MHRLHSPNSPKKQPSKLESSKAWIWSGGILLLTAVALSLLARFLPGFAQGYSSLIYPLLKGSIGRVCSLIPISVSEAGVYGLALFSICYVIRHRKRPLAVLSRAFFLISLLFFVFTVNCGINYYRNPFSYEAGFSMSPSSPEELYQLCEYLVGQINESAMALKNRPEGSLDYSPITPYPGHTSETPAPPAFYLKEMGKLGREAMSGLGRLYPQLAGWYPYPKPLVNSRLLSVQQLCGIYSPFTIEANYNREMPYYNIPHTICHELSHLKGYMREDEANFIGYLACVGSSSPDFRYSGYLTGWVYAGNALAKADWEGYVRLYGQLPPEALADLAWNNAFWDSFEGPVAEASTELNDRYLKVHSQKDGVQSYGRMVDLMLAYYRSQPDPSGNRK